MNKNNKKLLQAWIDKNNMQKLGKIGAMAEINKSDLTRKIVNDFIVKFEKKHGNITLDANIDING